MIVMIDMIDMNKIKKIKALHLGKRCGMSKTTSPNFQR